MKLLITRTTGSTEIIEIEYQSKVLDVLIDSFGSDATFEDVSKMIEKIEVVKEA
jgi:hypothetical protein